MNRYKVLPAIFFTILTAIPALLLMAWKTSGSFKARQQDSLITVPAGGNSWRTDKDTTGGNVSSDGIVHWSSQTAQFKTYIRIAAKGKLRLWINLKVPQGTSKIAVSAFNSTKEIVVLGDSLKDYYVGEWMVADTGYLAFCIKGIGKSGPKFADIRSLKFSGSAIDAKTAYVKNNEGNFFYWGRRGPSDHLNYALPDNINAAWFYNEVTVPKGNDVLGSYFMADGFAEGYFGMQVNSATERHILFSVWSPFATDNPASVPDDQKILLIKKGGSVHTGEFGNEGSGGQSYLLYNWKAGNTYKFLVHAKPAAGMHTIFTAYFFAPELNKWQLIASFSRPQTNTYLKRLHSFLENFEPEQGILTRKVLFGNQWIADENGRWTALNKARFTVDNTGAKAYRMDYAGGISNGSFFLQNCGFFDQYTPRNTFFERRITGKAPDIKLDSLP